MTAVVAALIVGFLLGVLATVIVYGIARRRKTGGRGRLLGVSGKPIPKEWGEPLVKPQFPRDW